MNRIFRWIKNIWKTTTTKELKNNTESKSDDNYPLW